jgi:hypothetical protein
MIVPMFMTLLMIMTINNNDDDDDDDDNAKVKANDNTNANDRTKLLDQTSSLIQSLIKFIFNWKKGEFISVTVGLPQPLAKQRTCF